VKQEDTLLITVTAVYYRGNF